MSYNADIDGRSTGLLPSQYQVSAALRLLFAGFWTPGLQQIEDDLNELKQVQFRWTTATGVWLDAWGKLAQLPRPAGDFYADDENYRRAIAARWASRRSLASPDDVVKVALELWQGGVAMRVGGLLPGLQLDVEFEPIAEERGVGAVVLYAAWKLGVSLVVTFRIPDEETFGFQLEAGPDPQVQAEQRAAGTFQIESDPTFTDQLRAGIYRLPFGGY